MTVRHVFDVDDPVGWATALLHDVLEDTTAHYDDLVERFNGEVAEAVAALAKDARRPEAEREAAYDRQLQGASWQARLIKLADVRDNGLDATDDALRGKVREQARRAIACAGDDPRLARAGQIVREWSA